MTRDEMKIALQGVVNPNKERDVIYAVLEELGITYRSTMCGRCNRDYLNIAMEELGMIDDASACSEFDRKYTFVAARPVRWRGHLMDARTDERIIDRFVEVFPNGYYIKNKNTEK